MPLSTRFVILLLSFAASCVFAADDAFEKSIRPMLENYCFKCHGPEKPKRGLNLAKFTDKKSILREPKIWKSVVQELRERAMPPEGKPQLAPQDHANLIAWIERTLNDIDDDSIPRDPGRVLIHRLSRLEYNNTVRDLAGITSNPADKFPADGGGGAGFDNIADTLFIPPILMEKYLDAAETVVQEADPQKIYSGGKLSKSNARETIETFARRAFRRPVEKTEVAKYVNLFESTMKRGDALEVSVKLALKAILVSPHFLYRIESDQSVDGPYQVNDYELATRLSYFIWSSMPDDELARLAAKKRLREPGILQGQVRRMLLDPKAKTLSENFAGQWLGVRGLKTNVQPDRGKFPNFTPELRDAMYGEAIQFFDTIVRDNGSLLDFINSDYTFLNETLAKHYGVQNVAGKELQRVTLSDKNRGGVLGMGAVLALTSYPQRTSPVLRGKWVLEEILGTPPPPPPPGAGGLSADDKPKAGKTFRDRLEFHRAKADCATCHKRMDPLGFGLENFDPVGRWRSELGGTAIDSTGVLPTGEKFNGPAELKEVLMKQKDEFTRNLTEKMLSYALGRGLEYYDAPTVKKISAATAQSGYRSQVLITEIAKSFPFQYRRNSEPQKK